MQVSLHTATVSGTFVAVFVCVGATRRARRSFTFWDLVPLVVFVSIFVLITAVFVVVLRASVYVQDCVSSCLVLVWLVAKVCALRADESESYLSSPFCVGLFSPVPVQSMLLYRRIAVIILRKSKEVIAFPGPGGYKIDWSPGTKLLPMVPAPSGHLVIPCDKFDKAQKNDQGDMTFCTDHTIATKTPQRP